MGGGLLVAAIIVTMVVMRPSPAQKLCARPPPSRSRAATTHGGLSQGHRGRGQPAELRGQDKYAALGPRLSEDDFATRREIFEKSLQWDPSSSAVLGGLKDLATRQMDKGDPSMYATAARSLDTYWKGVSYDKRDGAMHGLMDKHYKLGEKIFEEADKNPDPEARLRDYALAQNIFSFIDNKDISYNAYSKLTQLRTKRESLEKIDTSKLNQDLSSLDAPPLRRSII